jgi:dTDP-4-amino-4,6-dideoxygalactose transaminase
LFKERRISAVFHYVPLHSSKAGRKYGRFHGEDRHTTSESEKLIRLPIYYEMERSDVERVASTVHEFFGRKL